MMQIHLYCPDCLAELVELGREKGWGNLPPVYCNVNELSNDGLYTVTCPKGHTGKVVLKNLNYELLYDLGVNAIADGYYREAVASMTSALERFYEFFIKTSWRIQGVSYEVIEKNWKEMAIQSERQLGAFIVAYTALFGDVAPVMGNNAKNFRNSVIHKGEIPTREKTMDYAKNVLELIDGPLGELQKAHMEVVKEVFEHYVPYYEPTNKDENVLRTNHLTIISTNEVLPEDDLRKNRDIESLIKMVMEDRERIRMRLVDLDKKEEKNE